MCVCVFVGFALNRMGKIKMFSTEQNHMDSEINGGCNPIDSDLLNHKPNISQSMTTPSNQQPLITIENSKRISVSPNSNAKKSVMLNLKSGAINSTVEDFEHISTRFSDTFTRNKRRCRLWSLAIGIVFGCLICFAFGLTFNQLFDTRPCDDGELSMGNFYYLYNFII